MSGNDLRNWRERLKLTQKQAALLLDLSERMIAYYESGGRDIPFITFVGCIAYEKWPRLNQLIDEIIEQRQIAKCS